MEAAASKSDFSTVDASGIMLSSMANKHKEVQSELASISSEKAGVETSAGTLPKNLSKLCI